eukprot:6939708-Alexandrium_andersonii.AAC.1
MKQSRQQGLDAERNAPKECLCSGGRKWERHGGREGEDLGVRLERGEGLHDTLRPRRRGQVEHRRAGP